MGLTQLLIKWNKECPGWKLKLEVENGVARIRIYPKGEKNSIYKMAVLAHVSEDEIDDWLTRE